MRKLCKLGGHWPLLEEFIDHRGVVPIERKNCKYCLKKQMDQKEARANKRGRPNLKNDKLVTVEVRIHELPRDSRMLLNPWSNICGEDIACLETQ